MENILVVYFFHEERFGFVFFPIFCFSWNLENVLITYFLEFLLFFLTCHHKLPVLYCFYKRNEEHTSTYTIYVYTTEALHPNTPTGEHMSTWQTLRVHNKGTHGMFQSFFPNGLCAIFFLFLLHFDVICDLLLIRNMATWNLFAKWMYTRGY